MRAKTHATTAETKFRGKVDTTDASQLDGFMRGDVKLREDEAIAIAVAWANTTRPDAEACRAASKALNVRIAATRGVVLRGTEVFI
jgi:hypothetical protein